MASNSSLEVLFEPITINGSVFRNRLVQSAMYTRYATAEGEVSERHLAYMEARARGGVGLIITEDLVIDWSTGRGSGAPLRIDDDRMVPGLSELAEVVHRHGAKIAGQIYHAGRQSDHRTRQILAGIVTEEPPPLSASDVPSRAIVDRPRPMLVEEIERTVEQFADAARRLVYAGFDAIEIHAVHGYLLTQFFSPQSNRRTDAYGGTTENRARFARAVVRRVREVVGPDFPLICRLSADERVPGAASVEDNLTLASWLGQDGIDVFNVSAGTYDSREWIYTPPGIEQGSLVALAERVREASGKPVMGISKLGFDLELTAQFVREGRIDMAAMGRTQLADPAAILKARRAATAHIRPCIACCECAREFIAQQRRMQCVVNPELGNEFRRPLRRAVVPADVLVVGGGPTGLEAARAAALCGHRVTLWEARQALGGLLCAAVLPSFNQVPLRRLIDFYVAELDRLGVEIALERQATASEVREHEAGAVLVATGTRQTEPADIQGCGGLRTAAELLLAPDHVPDNVGILFADEPALYLAYHLAETGRTVTVVEPGPEAGVEISDITRANLLSRLAEQGVSVLTDRTVVEVARSGDQQRIVCAENDALRAFDEVVVSGPRSSVRIDGLMETTDERVRYLGTAVTPGGRLYRATQDGYWAAAELEARVWRA